MASFGHGATVTGSMAKALHLSPGARFGRLVVERQLPERIGGRVRYRCLCDCGNVKDAQAKDLRSGKVKSCGCLVRDQAREQGIRNAKPIPLGTRFERLVVLRLLDERKKGQLQYECRCDCSNLTYATGAALRRGDNQSCGCLKVDNRTTHGMTAHPLYSTWVSMRFRCRSLGNHLYGGRGITVAACWDDFAQYAAHIATLGPKPTPEHTIDRIDGNGNYEPGNVRWASPQEQVDNIRPEARQDGERHFAAKLTEAKVQKIRALATEGITRSALAAHFGVSEWAISDVVHRRNWKHI